MIVWVSVVLLLVSSVVCLVCSYWKNSGLLIVLYLIILVRLVCSLCGGSVCRVVVLVIIVCGG